MKVVRSIFALAAVLGIVIFLSSNSFAEEGMHPGKGRHEAKMKLLKDSAAALAKSNPDLAKQLNECVDKETKEMKDMKVNHEAKVKLFKDAAAALQQSNPDLSKGLLGMAEGKHKGEMKKMMEEKKEKEEVGEKIEPKSEQGEMKK